MPVNVIPEISVNDPKIVTPVVRFNAGVPVVPVKSMLLPSLGISAVTVCEALNAAFITTSSCGSGTLLVQALVLQLPPEVPDHVCAAEVSKVMPELPRASPIEVPVQVPAPPALCMSWKSAFVKDTAAVVTVRWVPTALDLMNIRFLALLPVAVNVPVIVNGPFMVNESPKPVVFVRVTLPSVQPLDVATICISPVVTAERDIPL